MTTPTDLPSLHQNPDDGLKPSGAELRCGVLLGVGVRIRFTRTLTEPPSEDHPGRLFATAGDTGEVVAHDCWEGYRVKTDHWPAAFGATRDEIEPLSSPNGRDEGRAGNA